MHYELTIPDWKPTSTNRLVGKSGWTVQKLKRIDREMVGYYAMEQRIPKATGKRRVSLVLCGFRGRRLDRDNLMGKSFLDALVNAGLLVDDSERWLEHGEIEYVASKERKTVIVLEEVST